MDSAENALQPTEKGDSVYVGYARDCGASQSLELQLRALSDAGCAKIFPEQNAGTPAGAGSVLQRALDFVRGGDTLVVTQLDRLAQCPNAIDGIIAHLAISGVNFRCLQNSRADSDGEYGDLFWPSPSPLLPSLKRAPDESASAIGKT